MRKNDAECLPKWHEIRSKIAPPSLQDRSKMAPKWLPNRLKIYEKSMQKLDRETSHFRDRFFIDFSRIFDPILHEKRTTLHRFCYFFT